MSNDPFEQIGPGVRSVSEESSSTVNGKVEQGVKKAREFYNRKEVKDSIRKAERLFKVAKDVKPSNPFSWAHGLTKVAETFYEFDKITTPPALRKFMALKAHGQELTTENVTHLLVQLFDADRIEELEKSISGGNDEGNPGSGPTLYSYRLSNPAYDAADSECGEPETIPVFWYNDNFEYSEIICSENHDKAKAKKLLSQVLWDQYGRQLEMLWSESREFAFRSKESHPWDYVGDFGLRLIERWKKAFEIGMRRFIILHGPPGTGKSTLARQLGEEVQANVLYVPIDTIIEANSVKYFSDALEVVQPDVVIIDDLDRMKSNLERLLALFEETENHVPLLLATTNHLNRLPDAIKRPGRFDEIWLMEPPPKEVRPRVIQYLASLEGIDLSEKQLAVIDEISGERKLSGAHIREIIRRVRLEFGDGEWGEIEFDSRDLTFSERWRPDQYTPEGIAVHEPDDF